MKQKITMLVILAMLMGAVAGCGTKAATTDTTATDSTDTTATTTDSSGYLSARNYKASDYVSVDNYKGVAASVDPQDEISDDDVSNYVDYVMSNYTTSTDVTDRAAQDGDTVHVLSVGTKTDGTEFDNSGDTGYDVTIGGTDYIDGYAEGLIGANIGDTVVLNLTFPADYSDTTLAGQAATFTLTVQTIKQTVQTELTDEFVANLDTQNGTTYATVDGFKAGIKTMLEDYAASTYKSNVQQAVLDAVLANATFQELPAELIGYYQDSITAYYTSQATSAGYDLETYLTNTYSMTLDDFNTEIATMAEATAKEELLCQLIAEKEKITVDDDTMNTQLKLDMADAGVTTQEEYLGDTDIEEYRAYLVKLDVLDFLVTNAVITENAADTTATDATTTDTTATDATTTTDATATDATTTTDTTTN